MPVGLILVEPQFRGSLTEQTWGGRRVEGTFSVIQAGSSIFLTRRRGLWAAHSYSSHEGMLSFWPRGGRAAGRRRWGWYVMAVNQTTFERPGEEGSKGVGKALNVFWL